ncbi:MAG: hypothetical protein B7Z02_07150 [Rhodobacterales bacterium 32-67-9]|nr:MAG: hypothetical protein B7Z02_07150 [Rhodobacterales bacterium 32-67-9]
MTVPPWSAIGGWVSARLQRRMVMAHAVVLIALSTVFLGVVSGLYRARLANEMERASLQVSGLLQAALENAMLKRDLPGLRAIIADLGEDRDILAVRVLSPDLEVRFASDPALEDEVLDTVAIRLALASRNPITDLGAGGAEMVRAIRPVPNQPRCQTCHGTVAEHPVNGLLIVDYAAEGLGAEIHRSMLTLMLAGLAVIGSSLLASWWVLRRTVLAPLARLTTGTEALAAGRLDHRIAVVGQDEAADLASRFNDMAVQLQGAMSQADSDRAVLQSVIDAIPDAIRVISPDYRIYIANAAYAAHVGQSLDQIIGQPCYRSSHGRSEPCIETLVVCPIVEARAGRLPLTCRQAHRKGAASDVHVEVAAAAVTLRIDGEDVPCVVEAIRDLDHQARLSQEQRLSELGLLAAGLAHEIYNPMSSINLLLDAARRDLADARIDAAAGHMKVIGEEVERTLKVTNSLLALCLPPSEDPVLVDLDRVVSEAVALLGYQARQSGSFIDCDIVPNLRLLGSESDLRMVVTNLVLNAIHAMPQGGRVRVCGRREGAEIVLQFSDEGIGIAPEDLGHIFLPFWTRRADGSAGRGLGLSIVQAIVTRWHGRITVKSRLGAGCTFEVHLPDPDAHLAGSSVESEELPA